MYCQFHADLWTTGRQTNGNKWEKSLSDGSWSLSSRVMRVIKTFSTAFHSCLFPKIAKFRESRCVKLLRKQKPWIHHFPRKLLTDECLGCILYNRHYMYFRQTEPRHVQYLDHYAVQNSSKHNIVINILILSNVVQDWNITNFFPWPYTGVG